MQSYKVFTACIVVIVMDVAFGLFVENFRKKIGMVFFTYYSYLLSILLVVCRNVCA